MSAVVTNSPPSVRALGGHSGRTIAYYEHGIRKIAPPRTSRPLISTSSFRRRASPEQHRRTNPEQVPPSGARRRAKPVTNQSRIRTFFCKTNPIAKTSLTPYATTPYVTSAPFLRKKTNPIRPNRHARQSVKPLISTFRPPIPYSQPQYPWPKRPPRLPTLSGKPGSSIGCSLLSEKTFGLPGPYPSRRVFPRCTFLPPPPRAEKALTRPLQMNHNLKTGKKHWS